MKLNRNTEKGIYRAMFGPAAQFNPESPSKQKAIDVIAKLLQEKKEKENWDWLDVTKISGYFELCYYTDYSSVTNEDMLFDAPNLNTSSTLHETNSPSSSLGFWYYKISCMKEAGRIFVSAVIYSDELRLTDIESSVDYWRNNPITVSKWVNETRQRLVQSLESKIVVDKEVLKFDGCEGVTMNHDGTVFKGGFFYQGRRRGSWCNWVKSLPGKNLESRTTTKSRVVNLIKQKVATEVTPKRFFYTMNNWVRETR